MNIYREDKVKFARKLRTEGKSLQEISTRCGIAKSTASLWVRDVILSEKALRILQKRFEYGKEKLKVIKLQNKLLEQKTLSKNAKNLLNKINIDTNTRKLICSIFFWTEGGKYTNSVVNFINSDPSMISTFLALLRKSFPIDESKFRALIHIHDYHNKRRLMTFWSELTNIDLKQFNKCYLKPHTRIRKRDGYMGCIRIKYYDAKIAKELRTIYNTFASMIGGVVQR